MSYFESWLEFWDEAGIEAQFLGTFVFWAFFYGPDSEESIEAKCEIWLYIFYYIDNASETVCSTSKDVWRTLGHVLVIALGLGWAIFREPWQILRGRGNVFSFLKRLVLALYWSLRYGPRFLLLLFGELRVNLALKILSGGRDTAQGPVSIEAWSNR